LFDSTILQLRIGPAPAPMPAPLAVMEALQDIEVTHGRGRNGFRITLAIGKSSPLMLALLPAGFFDPISTRVVISIAHRGIPLVLIDGIVTQQALKPGNEAGSSTLTLTGEDLSLLMDLVEVRIPWPAMPDAARVATILAKYATLGVVPRIVPPPVIIVESPTAHHYTQESTDRAYLTALAAQSGYVFYIDPGPLPGQSVGYFGPDHRLPALQPALNVNMDADSNVESLSFTLDGTAKQLTMIRILDEATGKVTVTVPVPPVNPLHPPLGARPTPPARTVFTEDTARLGSSEAAKRAYGIMRQSKDSITVSGSLNVASYGSVLRAGRMVGVRGAGLAFDGAYYVETVTHNIKPGEYKQSFTLARDGLGTLSPAVPA
jgi:hypothetical protein